jgi:hypothetical protein
MASAGNPFIEAGSVEANADAWSRTDGHFRRMPLNAPLKIDTPAEPGGRF